MCIRSTTTKWKVRYVNDSGLNLFQLKPYLCSIYGRFQTLSSISNIIPWEKLRTPDLSSPPKKMLWSPNRAIRHEHHLHTEEEVFKFCIENEFYFPSYLESNFIVFVPSLLKESKLLEEMRDFFWRNGWVIHDVYVYRGSLAEFWGEEWLCYFT